MLAAAPNQEARILSLFQLALRLVAQGEKPIPEQMKEYFNLVLVQARALASDPSQASYPVMPEAIQLALDMRHLDGLKHDIDQTYDIGSVSPDLASRILSRLERHVAA